MSSCYSRDRPGRFSHYRNNVAGLLARLHRPRSVPHLAARDLCRAISVRAQVALTYWKLRPVHSGVRRRFHESDERLPWGESRSGARAFSSIRGLKTRGSLDKPRVRDTGWVTILGLPESGIKFVPAYNADRGAREAVERINRALQPH